MERKTHIRGLAHRLWEEKGQDSGRATGHRTRASQMLQQTVLEAMTRCSVVIRRTATVARAALKALGEFLRDLSSNGNSGSLVGVLRASALFSTVSPTARHRKKPAPVFISGDTLPPGLIQMMCGNGWCGRAVDCQIAERDCALQDAADRFTG
jgi:hypothetical protein